MVNLLIIFTTWLAVAEGFDIKTRQLCCSLGKKYATDNKDCKRYETPIPNVNIDSEEVCLNTIEFCCKKQLLSIQCDLGKSDAKVGECIEEDGERRDCCEACLFGVEAKKSDGLCINSIGLSSPYSDIFQTCCEEIVVPEKPSTTTTLKPTFPPLTNLSTSLSADYKTNDDFYPGLSEENVCETGEYCAQLCEPTGKTYKCKCFAGYELMKDGVSCRPSKRANGSRCEKHNPCDHDCFDTGTSVECSCRTGYELAPDKKSCKDIDECSLGTHACTADEVCENEEGSYFCFETNIYEDETVNKCPPGHNFNAEKSVCDDTNECEIPLICPSPMVCKNTVGSYFCEGPNCPPGYQYKSSIEVCADIDECLTPDNNCNKDSQVCVNTNGNYTCVDKASKTNCPPGFKLDNETLHCIDIDECQDPIAVCSKDEQCINEQGAYKCIKSELGPIHKDNRVTPSVPVTKPAFGRRQTCPKGLQFNPIQNTCDDINECQLRMDNCSPMHRCDNTVGSFYCTRVVSCGTGYTLNSAKDLCEDDDECAMGTHNCHDLGSNYVCKNQMGTYKCEAIVHPYYNVPNSTVRSTTTTTTKTTTTTTTKPTTPTTLTPTTEIATTTPTTTVKSTPLVTKPVTPHSIWNSPWNRVPAYSSTSRYFPIPIYPTTIRYFPPTIKPIPHTTPYYTQYSSYYNSLKTTTRLPFISGILRKCLPGYVMDANGDCTDIDECETNPCPLKTKCVNFNGGFQCSAPARCKIGYEMNEAGSCVDVDECARGEHHCSPTQICKNGQGYYSCQCPAGHHFNRITKVCEDLDECIYKPCGRFADCTNTIGSYQCSCPSGYKKNHTNNGICDDINECEETPGLCQQSQLCVNMMGSYRCSCKQGYLISSDNRTCTDINECEKFHDRKLCIWSCVNTPGSYKCECPPGYNLGSNRNGCLDVNECDHNVCPPGNACVNIGGGYKCYPIFCQEGYVKDPNHKARCKRAACNPRDFSCFLKPEQYSYQFMTLASKYPLSYSGLKLYKIKGPDWATARAEFYLKLRKVTCPTGVDCVNESFIRKFYYPNNQLELTLIKSIVGPQEVELEIEMKLFQGESQFISSVVVYIIIAISEYTF